MKNMYLLVFFGLIAVSGCGNAAQNKGHGPGGSSDAGNSTPGVPASSSGSSGGDSSNTDSGDKFLIACPANIGAFPEVLMRQNGKVYLVSKVSSGVQYNYLAPGSYTSGDGRNCQFEVTNNGKIEEL